MEGVAATTAHWSIPLITLDNLFRKLNGEVSLRIAWNDE